MTALLSFFGRTLFTVLLGLLLGYGIMTLLLDKSVPDAMKNEKFRKYCEIFLICFIALFFVAAFLMLRG